MTLRLIVFIVMLGVILPGLVQSQTTPPRNKERVEVRLEPVAETSLLMEGMAQPNFRGLNRILKEKAPDQDGWVHARGQSLLLAETGNLLMLRPPKNQGQDIWYRHATALRDTSTKLARLTAARDLARSRTTLAEVANTCNQCHQTFRVKERVQLGEE
jgi:hypothetical protein